MVRNIIGTFGELLITAGVIVLLYIGWVMYVDDAVTGSHLSAEASTLSRQWADDGSASGGTTVTKDPPITKVPTRVGELFGVLTIPRIGLDNVRPIAVGVDGPRVLDRLGAGHYTETQAPGAVGNFALASHRGGHGSSFRYINTLRLGDKLYVETKLGWYVYDYRNTQYVMDTQVSVLNATPDSAALPTTRLLTLTSCNPYPLSAGERIIVFATFDEFVPRALGAPAAIKAR